jgi:hypothetical protein
MSTTETPGAATAEEHMAEARKFAASAEERPSHWDRSVDLQAAQVHATLAQTLKAAEVVPLMAELVASLEKPGPGQPHDHPGDPE